MQQIDEAIAKDSFEELLKKVENGEAITICRNGTPIAQLVPLKGHNQPRVGEHWKGLVRIREDFDEPLPGFDA